MGREKVQSIHCSGRTRRNVRFAILAEISPAVGNSRKFSQFPLILRTRERQILTAASNGRLKTFDSSICAPIKTHHWFDGVAINQYVDKLWRFTHGVEATLLVLFSEHLTLSSTLSLLRFPSFVSRRSHAHYYIFFIPTTPRDGAHGACAICLTLLYSLPHPSIHIIITYSCPCAYISFFYIVHIFICTTTICFFFFFTVCIYIYRTHHKIYYVYTRLFVYIYKYKYM